MTLALLCAWLNYSLCLQVKDIVGRVPKESDQSGGNIQLQANVEAIIEDFKILGTGLVHDIVNQSKR